MATRLTEDEKRARLLEELERLEAAAAARKIAQHQTLVAELSTNDEQTAELDAKEATEINAVSARFAARKAKLTSRRLEIEELLSKEQLRKNDGTDGAAASE